MCRRTYPWATCREKRTSSCCAVWLTPHRRMVPGDVSFWYLANRLGRRFLREAEQKLGILEPLGPGLWCCRLLGRLLFWISSVDLPVEEESLPLHLVGREPLKTERQVARLVSEQDELQERYSGWLASLHPAAWREVEAMSRTAGKKLKLDLRPAIEYLGLDRVIEQVGLDRVIEQVGRDRVIEEMGDKDIARRIGLDAGSQLSHPPSGAN